MFRALAGTVTSYRDGDFSFSLNWKRNDELGDLVAAHNALGDTLRDQRVALVQRELLLDTMVQNTPVAMLLFDAGRRVVYANLAARKLLHEGRRMEGLSLESLLERAPEPLRDAVTRGGDGLFAVEQRGRGGGLLPGPARLSPQRAAARAVRDATPHRRAPPPGGAHLEEGDPRDQPRAQQLARADRLAGPVRIASWSAWASTSSSSACSPPSATAPATWRASSRATPASPSCRRRAPETVTWPEFVERVRGQTSFRLDGPLPEALRLLRPGPARAGGAQPAAQRARVRVATRGRAAARAAAAGRDLDRGQRSRVRA